jgi:hypothetical protein
MPTYAIPAPKLIPTALTSPVAVQMWVNGTAPDASGGENVAVDAAIIGLINTASRMALSYINRSSFLVHTVTEQRTCYDQPSMMLQSYPVLSIQSVTIGNASIPAQTTPGNAGYVLDPWDGLGPGAPQRLSVVGNCFSSAPGSNVVIYTAGYAVQGESQTPSPTDGTVWPSSPLGRFTADWKVLDAAGAAMAPVTTPPSVGQYIAPTDDQTPYVFNTAQGAVNLYYSYIPADIDYAICKWVGEQYKYRTHIGLRSVSAQGQITTGYIIEKMPADVALVLNQYQRMVTV